MYSTGKGRFHVRSKCDVLDDTSGKRIIIHEIPYQVKKSDMLVHIAELVSKEVVTESETFVMSRPKKDSSRDRGEEQFRSTCSTEPTIQIKQIARVIFCQYDGHP